MDGGVVGGIIGSVGGIAGGAIGTYFSIKNTNGPRERSFMIRMSAVVWAGVSIFLVGLMLLPKPYNLLLWLPYGVALPLGISWSNRRQLQIRAEEAAMRESKSPHA